MHGTERKDSENKQTKEKPTSYQMRWKTSYINFDMNAMKSQMISASTLTSAAQLVPVGN